MNDLWEQIHDLFDTDDGSLPDIFVENLSPEQLRSIYNWLRAQSEIYCADHPPTFWDNLECRDVIISSVEDPAELVNTGRAGSFRHGLANFSFSGIELPGLTVAVFPNEIHFDYRMGPAWGPQQVTALFEFLYAIQRMAPEAVVSHADEGASNRTESFANAWRSFSSGKGSS